MRLLLIGLLSLVYCGWSAFTYIFNGMPADKRSYWANWLGFADKADFAPGLVAAVAAYREDPSFHNGKDVLVEWCRAWPQRAAKLLALVILGQGALNAVLGLLVVILALLLVL